MRCASLPPFTHHRCRPHTLVSRGNGSPRHPGQCPPERYRHALGWGSSGRRACARVCMARCCASPAPADTASIAAPHSRGLLPRVGPIGSSVPPVLVARRRGRSLQASVVGTPRRLRSWRGGGVGCEESLAMAFEHRAFEGQLLRPLGSYAQPLGGGGCWDCDVLTVMGLSAWMVESFRPKGIQTLCSGLQSPMLPETSCFRP